MKQNRKKVKFQTPSQPCACNCGGMTKLGNIYIHGHANKGKSKYVSLPCQCDCGKLASPGRYFISGHNKPMLGKHHIEETKEKCRIKPEGFGKRVSEALTGRKLSKEHCINIGLASARRKHTEETKMYLAMINIGKQHTEKTKQKMRKSKKELWQDPEFKEKSMLAIGEGLKIHPNKPETVILNLLNKMYPGEWKYTGDWSYVIAGKNPDFVNCNSQKKCIELFGDYWHKDENPNYRKRIYAKYGWDTLVIWERELKNIERAKFRINRFQRA